MEKKNLSDQDKRNYLAKCGWRISELSGSGDMLFVRNSLSSEKKFQPLSLEDAYASCMILEAAAKERFKESEYKPDSILDEEVEKERPNNLSIDGVEFERLKKYEEYRRNEDRKIMGKSVCFEENDKKCQTQKEERKCSSVLETPFLTTFINIEKEQTERLFELSEMIAGKLDLLIPLEYDSITDNPCVDYYGQLGMLRTFQESRANLIGKFEFLLINLQRII